MHFSSVRAAVVLVFCFGFLGQFPTDGAFRKSGKLRGILAAKSLTWIEVKVDGESHLRRFIPTWRGGLPKDGGHLDDYVLNKIAALRTGNRVELHWVFDDQLRLLNIRTLKPTRSRGEQRGTVYQKGDHWIDVKPENGPLQRFIPRWLGRFVEQGGGLDGDILHVIDETKVGDEVLIEWAYDDRKRIISFLDPNPPPLEPEEKETVFPPGYPYLLPPEPGEPWFPERVDSTKSTIDLPLPPAFSKPSPATPIIDNTPVNPLGPKPVPPPLPTDPFGAGPPPVNPSPVEPSPIPDNPFDVATPPKPKAPLQENPFE